VVRGVGADEELPRGLGNPAADAGAGEGSPIAEEVEAVAEVGGEIIRASIDGVIRGLLRPGAVVTKGLKLGDIDPRGCVEYCFTLSDKARAVAGSVLEVVCRAYNTGRES